MKAHKLLSLLVLLAFIGVACTEDENGSPRQVNKAYTYSQTLRGSEGVKGELELADLRLDNIMGADTINRLTRADLQLAKVYLELTGLHQLEHPDTIPVVLEDFTITIGTTQSYILGDFTTNPQGVNELGADIQYSTDPVIDIIQAIFSTLTSGSRRAVITVSFRPNVDITTSDNVRLNVHFEGIYHFVVDE